MNSMLARVGDRRAAAQKLSSSPGSTQIPAMIAIQRMASGQSTADQSVWLGKTPSASMAPPKIMAVTYCRNAFSTMPT